MENDVFVLILGATEGAYALSHAFFHDYGIRATVMDTDAPACLGDSCALVYEHVPGLDSERMLLLAVERFYERHSGKSLFLLFAKSCYERAVDAHRAHLETMFFLPRASRGEGSVCGAKGLLFVYRSTSGQVRTAYAKTASWDKEGAPTVLLVEDFADFCPDGMKDGSFALLAEDENGHFHLVDEPLCAAAYFLVAADASLPEWLISDYVLCEALPPTEQIKGMYSLCPYRMHRDKVCPSLANEAKHRHSHGVAVALFDPKREKGLLRRRRVRRLAQKLAQG